MIPGLINMYLHEEPNNLMTPYIYLVSPISIVLLTLDWLIDNGKFFKKKWELEKHEYPDFIVMF
jgi:hypothetical protein